ncbi:OmpA family protein [Treponema sp.]|uniref:OmpA family protein n=1 Tax=Treponema sp. TaxID=166 RepID=UPI00388F3C56
MKKTLITFIAFLSAASLFSQTKLAYSGDSGYTLVERTNLRRYVNGKYSGLTSREVRSFVSRTSAPDGIRSSKKDNWYDGNFFVSEDTLRYSKTAAAGVHDSIPSVFKISSTGRMSMLVDNGYPAFRSFPSYTSEALRQGDSWKAEAERAVDPLNKGVFTRIPILVLYTFSGEELYKGENVYRIKAIWQTNYGFSNFDRDPKGDDSLVKATGGHKADIIVRASTGEAVLISDNVDETFYYTDGSQVNFKGTITQFTEYPPAIDREKLITAINRIAKPDISFEETPAGLKLSLKDIKFMPDSDEILPSEKSRLDEIAKVLKIAKNSHFLIEGHTASTGKPAGEKSLSEKRARKIALELSGRGLPADNFICRGLGGSKPVADNETEEGRAQNRRVEITILQ